MSLWKTFFTTSEVWLYLYVSVYDKLWIFMHAGVDKVDDKAYMFYRILRYHSWQSIQNVIDNMTILCISQGSVLGHIQYIPRNMHTVFALLCFVVVIHWLIFPYPSGLLHWHCGNLTIAPVPAKQPWWIWINTSCEFVMNDCITTTKQSTTKSCAYFLGYTVPTGTQSPNLGWWMPVSGSVLLLSFFMTCGREFWIDLTRDPSHVKYLRPNCYWLHLWRSPLTLVCK